jgi:hypothetical protein
VTIAQRVRTGLAVAACAAAVVADTAVPSAAINENVYEVAVIRCPDQGTSLFLNYGYLDDASQQEVNSVRYQAKNPGVTNQVRLSKITSVSPKITTLLSQWTDPC